MSYSIHKNRPKGQERNIHFSFTDTAAIVSFWPTVSAF